MIFAIRRWSNRWPLQLKRTRNQSTRRLFMRRYRALEVTAFVMLLVVLGCKSESAPAPTTVSPTNAPEQAAPAKGATLSADGKTGHEMPNGKKIKFSSPNANSVYDVVVDTSNSTGSCTWEDGGTATTVTVRQGNPKTCTFTANNRSDGVLIYTINFTSPPTVLQYSVISCKGC